MMLKVCLSWLARLSPMFRVTGAWRVYGVVAVCLFAFGMLPVAAAEPGGGGIAQLQQFVINASTAEGAFRQSVVLGAARRPQLSSGRFAFERPGRFRWVVENPYPQLLVSDGGRLWIWDEDLNQLTIQELGDALGNTPAAILAGEGALEQAFELTDEGVHEGLAWVRAVPRQSDSSFESMRLGLTEGVLLQMELRDHFGQLTTIEFVFQHLGGALAPDLFRFTPPPGADVMGSLEP